MKFPGLDPTSVGLDSPLYRSQRYLASAYDSVASLYDETYPALRATRTGSRGRLTHAEQDIFRAAVVFAGAGLDTVFKEAMRSCIAIQVDRSDGVRAKYLDFVTRFIQAGPTVDARQLASLLTSTDPSQALKDAYIDKLTGSSLQSLTQVTAAMSALGLQDEKELFKEAKSLNPLFRVRNEIAHEPDMTPEPAGGRGARHRRERAITQYKTMCHGGLNFAQRMLNALEPKVC